MRLHHYPAQALSTSASFIFDPFPRTGPPQRVVRLEVQVVAGSDVTMGVVRDSGTLENAIAFEQLVLTAGRTAFDASSWIMTGDSAGKRRHKFVRPGWVIQSSDQSSDDGKYVTRVDGDVLVFNDALSGYVNQAFTLMDPYVADISNGFILPAGTWKSWSAPDPSDYSLSVPLEFTMATGTAHLIVAFAFA